MIFRELRFLGRRWLFGFDTGFVSFWNRVEWLIRRVDIGDYMPGQEAKASVGQKVNGSWIIKVQVELLF